MPNCKACERRLTYADTACQISAVSSLYKPLPVHASSIVPPGHFLVLPLMLQQDGGTGTLASTLIIGVRKIWCMILWA